MADASPERCARRTGPLVFPFAPRVLGGRADGREPRPAEAEGRAAPAAIRIGRPGTAGQARSAKAKLKGKMVGPTMAAMPPVDWFAPCNRPCSIGRDMLGHQALNAGLHQAHEGEDRHADEVHRPGRREGEDEKAGDAGRRAGDHRAALADAPHHRPDGEGLHQDAEQRR